MSQRRLDKPMPIESEARPSVAQGKQIATSRLHVSKSGDLTSVWLEVDGVSVASVSVSGGADTLFSIEVP